MLVVVKREHFVKNESWFNNDWYACPNCSYDSLDVGFRHCPDCGEVLLWDIE